MLQLEVGPGRLVCRDLAAMFVVVPSSTDSGWCLLLTASPGGSLWWSTSPNVLCVALWSTHFVCVCVTLVRAHLDGKFLWAVRTCRAQTQMKCPDVFPGSFYTQTMPVTAATTTLLCSDSRQRSHSQTTSDLCVWLPLTVCSTGGPIAGSLAGELSVREVSLQAPHKFLLGLQCSCHMETLAFRPDSLSCCRSLSVVTVP